MMGALNRNDLRRGWRKLSFPELNVSSAHVISQLKLIARFKSYRYQVLQTVINRKVLEKLPLSREALWIGSFLLFGHVNCKAWLNEETSLKMHFKAF